MFQRCGGPAGHHRVMEGTGTRLLERAWSVSALLLAISDALTSRLGGVTVTGELAGFTRAASGHCYFSLKDADGAPALVRCAMFRRAASLLDFAPADGQRVEAHREGHQVARGQRVEARAALQPRACNLPTRDRFQRLFPQRNT